MKRNILILMTATLIGMSCSKFLDIKPVGKLIPTEIQEFDNLLFNTNTVNWNYSDNNRGCCLIGLSDNVYMSDIVVKYAYNPQTVNLDRIATYTLNPPYLPFDKPDYYLEWGIYRQLGIFNTAIDGVRNISGAEESVFGKEVIAQAMAGRAWSMYHGAITYGPMYNKSGANDTKVLPYRTDSDPSKPSPQLSTTEEIFNLAIEDLEYSLNNCPDRVASPSRASKAVANALLAEIYMFMGDYEKMYSYAKTAWDIQMSYNGNNPDNLLYNYNDFKYEVRDPMPVPDDPEADVRTLLLIESTDDFHLKTYAKENLFYREATASMLYSKPNQEYLDLFEEGDMRKELFIMKNIGYKQKFTGMGPGGSDVEIAEPVDYYDMRNSKLKPNLGITYPYLLLMVAEGAARTNKVDEAMSALRILRANRYKPENAPIANLSGDALINEVLRERRRELPLTTPHRYWDLKRYAVEDASKPWVKKNIVRTVMGETMNVDINSEMYQLQIGNSYRSYNPHWNLPPISGVYNPYKYGNPFQ